MKNIVLIAAMGNQRELGFRNELLWHLPNDMKHFKQTTSGHTVIMGRKTWNSLKIKPLPNRRNIVLTRNKEFNDVGCEVFHSVSEVIDHLSDDEVSFVIGGANVYSQFMEHANTLYLTRVIGDFEADVFFPVINMSEWNLSEEHFIGKDDRNPYDVIFQTYCKTRK